MRRLLFAAARGARLQVMAGNTWYGITQIYMPFRRDARSIRIHPDDLHLQYGPISSALRKMAINGDVYAAEIPYIQGYWDFTREEAYTFIEQKTHRSLFLLILAEALADSGL